MFTLQAIPNFFQYPDYFPLFMVWASGYVFAYVVFGKSRVWRDIDSTMKVVVALVTGFAIEFGLILPLFYLSYDNAMSTGLFLPAFNKTWIYIGMLTLIVSLLALRSRRWMLQIVNYFFSKILYNLFVVLILVFAILILSYIGFYPDYVKVSTSLFLFYLFLNFIFVSVGFVFCMYFQEFTKRAYEEEKIYGDFEYRFPKRRSEQEKRVMRSIFIFKVNAKQRIESFLRSKKLLIPLVAIVAITFLIIPLDSSLGIFTPKVNYLSNFGTSKPEYHLFVNLIDNGYGRTPTVEINCSNTLTDVILITPQRYSSLDSLNYGLPAYLQGRHANILYSEGGLFDWATFEAITPFSMKDDLKVASFPTDSDLKGLQVNYSNVQWKSFNITLIYWNQTTINGLFVNAEKPTAIVFNETYNKWTYSFQVVNNNPNYVHLQEVSCTQLFSDGTNMSTIELICNGKAVDPIDTFGDTIRAPFSIWIAGNSAASIQLSFLSKDKFP